MRLLIYSDLHLEFGDFAPPSVDADVVILAGDIHVGTRAAPWIGAQFGGRPVLYVLGNHEYYRENFDLLPPRLRAACDGVNARMLERDEVILGDVRFLGATLWTDYEVVGPRSLAMDEAAARLNDHHLITTGESGRRLKPADLLACHQDSVRWLLARLSEPFAGRTVIVTHHAPSPRSLHPRYRGHALNGAFASDLEWMMGPTCALWVHGHLHDSVDFTAGGTRVICNPRGYAPKALNPDFRPDFVVEV